VFSNLTGKKILITGATGFAGSHLADYINREIDCKLIITRRHNSNLNNLKQLMGKEKISWDYLDVLDPNSCDILIKKYLPDYIFYFAANSWVTPSWEMPNLYFQTNAIGTVNFFESIRKYSNQSRCLISCTPEEYGDVSKEDLPITENSKIHPVNPYAASKVAQEMVALAWEASYNLDVIRTRVFNHEGPRRSSLGANASFAYQIARIENNLQEPILDVGNLSALRNFTSIFDVVEAYALAMDKGLSGNLYLIGNDENYTMEQTLSILLSLSKIKDIKIRVDSTKIRPTELNNFVGDFSKFKKLTGWKPKIAIDQILLDTLNYWRTEVASKNYLI
jgi:GDP-4-dehydro-6-deoxy-D-mannose reductase